MIFSDKKKVRKRKKNEALKDNSNKRKIHDDFDDRLDDDDYDLIEENIGVKLKRKSFKRVRKLSDSESDDDEVQSKGDVKSAIADELFGKDSDDVSILLFNLMLDLASVGFIYFDGLLFF